MKRSLFSLLLLSALSLNGMEIDHDSVQSPRLGKVALYHGIDGFTVQDNEGSHLVHSYDVHKSFRGKSSKDIARYAKVGVFLLKKYDNGEYQVDESGRLNGGGPISGSIAYGLTKLVCYGVGVAAVGQAANNLSNSGVSGATIAIGANSISNIASTNANVVGVAILGSNNGQNALNLVTGTATAVSASSIVSGGLIEGLACSMGALFTWLPFP